MALCVFAKAIGQADLANTELSGRELLMYLVIPPEQFIVLALQDSLEHDGIHFLVQLKVA